MPRLPMRNLIKEGIRRVMIRDSEQSAVRRGVEGGRKHGREVGAEEVVGLLWGVGSDVSKFDRRRERFRTGYCKQ